MTTAMTKSGILTEIFGTYYYDCELLAAWRNQNDRGEVYAEDCDMFPPTRVAYLDAEGSYVATDGDRIIVVCNANGYWAQDVTDLFDADGNLID